MRLKFRKSELFDDWYLIERAEHNGSSGLTQTAPFFYSFWHAARFSDADVEGAGSAMLAQREAVAAKGND